MKPGSRIMWLMATLLLLAFSLSRLQANFWLNMARRDYLKGNDMQAAVSFARSLAQNPENQCIRGETVKALARIGDYETASTVLCPLLSQTRNVSQRIDLLLATRQVGGALQLYSTLAMAPLLSYQVAAQVADGYLERDGNLPLDRTIAATLLAQAMGFSDTSPEIQVLFEQFTNANFWSTETGQRSQQALLWRSKTQPAEGTLIYGRGESFVNATERVRVAMMLGVVPASVQLGGELVFNGSFEDR